MQITVKSHTCMYMLRERERERERENAYKFLYSFFDDISNLDMMQLVVPAQLANDVGLPHCRWSQYTCPDRQQASALFELFDDGRNCLHQSRLHPGTRSQQWRLYMIRNLRWQ